VRQIGGSVGLAIAGTIFSSTFANTLPAKLVAAGTPRSVASTIAGQRAGTLTGVGNVGSQLGSALPPQLRPLVPQIIGGVQDAMAGAVADLFWLGAAAGALALASCALVRNASLHDVAAPVGGVERGGQEPLPAHGEAALGP
jgi:hypothetical protein